MSENTEVGLALATFYGLIFLFMAIHPTLRRRTFAKIGQWLYLIRYATVEMPLRAATGRHRPDRARIASLERTELP